MRRPRRDAVTAVLPDPAHAVVVEEEREIRAVAHELKTPLAIVYGYATTLLQQDDLPEESRRWFLRVIADQSRRLLRAIDRLDELTRMESGIQTESLDLVRATREAVERAIEAVPGTRIEGPARSLTETVHVVAARPWLDLALEEALVACASATGQGGLVSVGAVMAHDGDGHVRLDVLTTPPAQPQGLGVYLARRIVDQLGGTLEEQRGRLRFILRAV